MNNKKRSILIWIVLLIVVGGAVFAMIKFGGSTPSGTSSELADLTLPTDRILGNKDAKVSIVEYSDYQCPACAAYYPLIKQLMQDFNDQIKLVYRDFPLSQHSNAKPAAYAAEAAGIQGKYWEMHDLIFANQQVWESRTDAQMVFNEFAGQLGLDLNKFKADVGSQAVKDKVQQDYDSGTRSKITGTPTIFINGSKMQPISSYGELKNNVQQAINQNH